MGKLAKAVICREWNKPVVVEEVEIESPRRGEVMIKLAACGVCHSDLSATNGTIPLPPPLVLGHEGAGHVVEVGEGVSDFAVGDTVVVSWVAICGRCRYCVMGRPALCDNAQKAALTLPDGAGFTTLLSVPGLGALRASCANGVTTTQWQNTAPGAVTVVNQTVLHLASPGRSDANAATVAAGATTDQPTNAGTNGEESVMWQASDDSSGGDRVSTMWVTAGGTGTSCRITAQGLATATP